MGGGYTPAEPVQTKIDATKAPGVPTAQNGFIAKKNWNGQKVKNPNGGGYGYPDQNGNVWIPTGAGPSVHGGPHWDVQFPGGGYKNVPPGGGQNRRRRMKISKLIDGALNTTYSIYAVTDGVFKKLFPEEGQDIEFAEEAIARLGKKAATPVFCVHLETKTQQVFRNRCSWDPLFSSFLQERILSEET